MKKIALLLSLAVLTVIGFGVSRVSAQPVAKTAAVAPTVYTGIESDAQYGFVSFQYGLWAGKTLSAGTVTVVNDLQNIYVTVSSPALIGEVHINLYGSTAVLPTSRPVPGQAPYSAKNVNAHEVTIAIPVSGLAAGQTFTLAVHVALYASVGETDPSILALSGQTAYAAGNTTPVFSGKGAWFFLIGYTVTPFIDDDDDVEITTETAWAFGGAYAVPFGSTRWGWSNGPLTEGTYLFDIYAAAGGNNLAAGTLVGTLSVRYLNGTVTATYSLFAGFTLNEVHLYVGSDFLPTGRNGNFTYAPGQFPNIAGSLDATSYTFVVGGLSGSIYVAAHAVVAGNYGN